MNPKPFEEWTFEELCAHMAWMTIQGITRGDQLKSTMWAVANVVIQWRDLELKKEKAK